VFTGVLNTTVESSEETKVVRGFTGMFLHEEYDHDTLIHDIANIKVGLLFKYEKQIFFFLVDMKYMCI